MDDTVDRFDFSKVTLHCQPYKDHRLPFQNHFFPGKSLYDSCKVHLARCTAKQPALFDKALCGNRSVRNVWIKSFDSKPKVKSSSLKRLSLDQEVPRGVP